MQGAQSRQVAIEAAIDKENSLLRPRGNGPRITRHKTFPRQRIGALTKILRYLHGGPCQTDDGEVYFDLVAPFLVWASAVERGDPVAYVAKWSNLNVPVFAKEIGSTGIEARVNAMVRQMEDARRDRVRWTPDMKTIVSALQLRLETVRAVGLRGFGSINPPSNDDKKASQRERMTKLRRSRGVKSQGERTKGKCDDAVAVAIGLKGRRMIQVWRKNGVLGEKLRPFIESGVLDFAKVCAPSLEGEYGEHTFAKSDLATHGHAEKEVSSVPRAPANDDDPMVTPPVTETGYTGRNMQMDASEVRYAISVHPAISDDIKRHLDAIDAAMVKTPEERKLVVRRNLLRDRSRLAHRERRSKEKAMAA